MIVHCSFGVGLLLCLCFFSFISLKRLKTDIPKILGNIKFNENVSLATFSKEYLLLFISMF